MSKPNNPPAFPVSTGSDGGCLEYGMTLRDYFAAKAMQGFLSCADTDIGRDASLNSSKCSEWAFQIADAMLEARAK